MWCLSHPKYRLLTLQTGSCCGLDPMLCCAQLQNAAQNGDTSSIANSLAVSTGGKVESVSNANSQAFTTEQNAISSAVSDAVAKASP